MISAIPAAHRKDYLELLKSISGRMDLLLREAGIKAKGTKILKGGYSGNVIMLAKDRRREYFVKIARKEPLSGEVYWYGLVERKGIFTPRLLSYDLSMERFPFRYEIMEYMRGSTPARAELYDAGRFAGRELAAMHRIRAEGFGSVDNRFEWQYKSWLETLNHDRKWASDRTARRILSQREIDRVDECTIHNRKLEIKRPMLLHGDLWSGNILSLEKGKRFVMTDPGYIIGGDPMYDLAYATVPRAERYEKGVIEGYGMDRISEKEMQRFKCLRAYCIFKEAVEYVEGKEASFKIRRLVNALRSEMAGIS